MIWPSGEPASPCASRWPVPRDMARHRSVLQTRGHRWAEGHPSARTGLQARVRGLPKGRAAPSVASSPLNWPRLPPSGISGP